MTHVPIAPWRTRALATALLAAPFGLAPAGVAAQTAVDDAVANRARPDFAAQCVDLGGDAMQTGGFRVCPAVAAQAQYEDNVFRDADDERGDVSVRVAPTVRVASDWAAHAVAVTGTLAATRYRTETSNDSTDYGVAGSGRLDVSDDVKLSGAVAWARAHRDRGDADSTGFGGDVDEFSRTSQAVGLRYAPSEFSLGFDFQAVQLDFDDTGAVDNDDEDRVEYTLALRGALNLGSGLSVFVTPQFELRDYDRVVNGVERDSRGYDIQAGAAYDLSGVTFVQAGVGAFHRDFDDPDFDDATGASISARAVWNVTDLQTVTLSARRGLEETGETGASSIVETDVSVGVDFDLADNLLLNTSVAYQNEDFRDSGREDDVYAAGIGAEFFLNRTARATASARHQRRRSSLDAEGFNANTFSVGLRLQY